MARQVELTKGSRFIVLASICIVVASLYFAQDVLIPLALAILFCFWVFRKAGHIVFGRKAAEAAASDGT